MRLLTIVLTIYSYKQLYAYTYQINLQQIIMFLLTKYGQVCTNSQKTRIHILTKYGQVCTNSQRTHTYTYQIWSSMYQFAINTYILIPNMIKYVPICNKYVLTYQIWSSMYQFATNTYQFVNTYIFANTYVFTEYVPIRINIYHFYPLYVHIYY